ncbi:MAG TPA: efflux RND transporter permease subunit [Planctomycetota bacterium]
MDRVIQWSLRNRAVVLILAVALSVWGAITASRAPVDVFPDLSAPTVTVVTEAPGMASTEVESLVTFPIEATLNGASGVRRVRSTSSIGISIVYVEFEWGTEIFRARQIVAEKLGLVAASLPEQAGTPALAPISSIMGEILFVGLSYHKADSLATRTFADTVMRRRLLAVPGVSQVTPIGGGSRQYQVWLKPERLESYGITIGQVAGALRAANANVPAGFVVEGGSESLVTGVGRFRDAADIEAVAVAGSDGVPIQVKDLGRVRVGPRPPRGAGSVQGDAAVVIGIQKQPEVNTLELTGRLDAVLDELEESLPPGTTLHRDLLRQADFIETAVDNLIAALRDGGILVVLVVGFFLVNLGATFITLTAIPFSLLGAVLVVEALGGSINTMSLGGLAIAIGALVDDAVIDVENVVRRLRENRALPEHERRSSLPVVLGASVEIRSSIVFATLIIILVFLPLFFLDGVEGRLLQPLGLAYVAALAVSLLVAVTVTPALCSLLLPNSKAVRSGKEVGYIRGFKHAYRRLLEPILRHPWLAVVPTLALLVTTALAARGLGTSFLPEFNEGALTINGVTLPGTALEQTDRLGRMTERILMAQPEVVSVSRRSGRAELDEHAEGTEFSEFDVRLRPDERGREQFLDDLRRELAIVPGVLFTIGQPISHRIDHMLSGTRAAVAVKFFGPDLQELRALAESAKEAIQDVDGVVDLAVEQQAAVPALQVVFDRRAMGRMGVDAVEAGATLQAAFQGFKATELLDGGFPFDVVLRIDALRDEVAAVGGIPVMAGPARAPLSSFAEIVRDATPNKINRENGQRKMVVSCNVAGRDLVSVVEDIRTAVQPLVADLPAYRVEYGGQFESAQSARERIFLLGTVVVLGIGFLLRLSFGNSRDAAFVMANLPLALIGGVAGAWLGGGVLSVGSLIGFITVFGIATRNGIMLVSHIRHLQVAEGVADFHQAVLRGSTERLVPIVMTALATGIALVPLAMAGGEPGNEIQTPMALVILCGLVSSTLLNMVVVPALYLRFGRPARMEAA